MAAEGKDRMAESPLPVAAAQESRPFARRAGPWYKPSGGGRTVTSVRTTGFRRPVGKAVPVRNWVLALVLAAVAIFMYAAIVLRMS